MKKGIGIVGILLTAALWYLAAAGGSFHPVASTRKPAPAPENSALSFAPNPFFLATTTGSSVRSLSQTTAPAPQPFSVLGWVPAAAERLLSSRFAQYASWAGVLLIQFRKADLIFPFHYFW